MCYSAVLLPLFVLLCIAVFRVKSRYLLKWSAFNSHDEPMISNLYQPILSSNHSETLHSHSASAIRRFHRKTDFLERRIPILKNHVFDDSSQPFACNSSRHTLFYRFSIIFLINLLRITQMSCKMRAFSVFGTSGMQKFQKYAFLQNRYSAF